MARISGVDLPREKRIEIALTYIFGIGVPSARKILAATGVNPDVRVKDLSEDAQGQAPHGGQQEGRHEVAAGPERNF